VIESPGTLDGFLRAPVSSCISLQIAKYHLFMSKLTQLLIPYFEKERKKTHQETNFIFYSAVNHIILITKYYIYLSKINQSKPIFKNLLLAIKHKIKIETFSSTKTEFTEKWGEDIPDFFRL
jgi:hypothetical protein